MSALDELARRTHEPIEELERWQALGLIDGYADHKISDTERVRLIQFARRRGVSPDDIAEVTRVQGDVLGTFIDLLMQTTGKREGQPIAEFLASSDLDVNFAARALTAAGLTEQTEIFDDDLEALHWMQQARDAGFPDDAVIQLLRVYTDALNRVADAENRLFHYYVHEQFRRDGMTGRDLMNATSSVSQSLVGLVEPALLYFHRKAWERALREDLMLHLIEDVSGEPSQIPGTVQATTLFVDLASFTMLTSALGDEAGARTLDQFSDLVRETAVRCSGKLVKQIGDAFMLVFTDPDEAVQFGLDIRDAAASTPDFPAVRIGAHTGPVLYREGDYVGTNVNVAARVAALAQRGEFVVTAATRDALTTMQHATYVALGEQHLKGIPEGVEAFAVRR